MKKLILAAFLLGLMSCEKEKVNYNRDCNCGTVANDGIDGNCYWLNCVIIAARIRKYFVLMLTNGWRLILALNSA